MKKKQLLLLPICMALLTIFFVGCGLFDFFDDNSDGNSNDNKTPPPAPAINLIAPYLMSFGTYLSWETVSNATEYDIYCNNRYVETITKTTYNLNDVEYDSEYYVIAKNNGKSSPKSNIAVASKNTNFSNSEILDLTGKSSYNSSISSSVRKVIIANSSSFAWLAAIEERTADLTFELRNVNIIGSIYTHDLSYSRSKSNFNVTFEITGDCSIKGADGSNGFDFSDSRYDNSELAAGTGGNGGNAIIVPTVIITGSGNFTVTGGNGGNGGVGSATSKWESSSAPGKGSNGGNGGAGVKTSYFILKLNSANNTVTVSDGKGGAKGTPGVNGSIITGPAASIMWKDMYDIGKVGEDGRSSFGTKRILSGRLIY